VAVKSSRTFSRSRCPLDLVRRIRTSPQGRKAVRLPSPRRQAKLTLPRVAAACLLTFVLGGGLGYVLALKPASAVSPLIADAGDAWLDDVVAHYRTFSRMDGRLAELPASEPAAIIEWLLGNTGVNFRIPDLSDNGLAFEGARMLVAGGMPVGQLVYTSGEGEVISLLFRKNRPDEDGFSELIRDNIALVSWRSATATYVVVGPSLRGVARRDCRQGCRADLTVRQPARAIVSQIALKTSRGRSSTSM
jgi:anti-sigma factor RsiW